MLWFPGPLSDLQVVTILNCYTVLLREPWQETTYSVQIFYFSPKPSICGWLNLRTEVNCIHTMGYYSAIKKHGGQTHHDRDAPETHRHQRFATEGHTASNTDEKHRGRLFCGAEERRERGVAANGNRAPFWNNENVWNWVRVTLWMSYKYSSTNFEFVILCYMNYVSFLNIIMGKYSTCVGKWLK